MCQDLAAEKLKYIYFYFLFIHYLFGQVSNRHLVGTFGKLCLTKYMSARAKKKNVCTGPRLRKLHLVQAKFRCIRTRRQPTGSDVNNGYVIVSQKFVVIQSDVALYK